MNKLPQSNLKRTSNKYSKNKKKQPLKVVYITNPIMFKTNSASEFRALVQEFTGKYAETPEYYSDSPVAYGGLGEAVEADVKVASEDSMRCAALDRELIEMGHGYSYCTDMMMMSGYDNMGQIGSDPVVFDPFHEDIFNDDDPKILEGVKGLEGSSLCPS